MNDTALLLQTIKSESQKIDEAMRLDIQSFADDVDPLLVEVLEYGLFNGGKRIRPVLAVLSARMCGYDGDDIYKLGIAFEYLHAATLFHDDVIDNAETRRGKVTVSKQFGLVSAILAGDFLHARSMEIIGRMAGSDGLKIFCEATAGMVDGEFMQLRNAAELSLSETDYYNAIMGKTGLLIAASCEIGALFAGAEVEQQKAMRMYGEGLGCAFQMIDDLLDYTGDTAKTGKAVGNDLIEGKMTLPIIITLARANAEDEIRLTQIIENPELRETSLQTVFSLIEKYDAFEETRSQAQSAAEDAIAKLAILSKGSDEIHQVMTSLTGYVLSREK